MSHTHHHVGQRLRMHMHLPRVVKRTEEKANRQDARIAIQQALIAPKQAAKLRPNVQYICPIVTVELAQEHMLVFPRHDHVVGGKRVASCGW